MSAYSCIARGHEWRRRERRSRLVAGMWTGGPVDRLTRTLLPRVLSLAFLKHEKEPWEQGWLLARWLEYKVAIMTQ